MNRKERNLRIIIIIILIIIVILDLLLLLDKEKVKIFNGESSREVSDKEVTLEKIRKENKDREAFTEITGYGQITLDKDYPDICLMNSENNNVYLSYDVYCDNQKLYSTGLIHPGKMETCDIYSCLDAGKHTLIYKINSYDLDTKQIYWSGIKQEQNILINK